MQDEKLIQEIRQLAKQRNALILAHNYQRDEIQEIADLTGDLGRATGCAWNRRPSQFR